MTTPRDMDEMRRDAFGPEIMGQYGSSVRLIDEFAMRIIPVVYVNFNAQKYSVPEGWRHGIAREAYDLAAAMIDERRRREAELRIAYEAARRVYGTGSSGV